MALIIEGIFVSKTVTSLQIKIHECYVKSLKPRVSLLKIDEEREASDESEEEQKEDDIIEDFVVSNIEEEETEKKGNIMDLYF